MNPVYEARLKRDITAVKRTEEPKLGCTAMSDIDVKSRKIETKLWRARNPYISLFVDIYLKAGHIIRIGSESRARVGHTAKNRAGLIIWVI